MGLSRIDSKVYGQKCIMETSRVMSSKDTVTDPFSGKHARKCPPHKINCA